MDMCAKHSIEIAFEGSICPACDQVEDLKSEIEDLKGKIEKLEEKE